MSYEMIDRFLRNNLDDIDYADYSEALDSLVARTPLTDEQWQVIADTLGCFISRPQKDAIEATIGITGDKA